jgi:hypothetical protein
MVDSGTKSHRIASAIYLVTGFFNDSEPMKWRLRTLSNDLVSEKEKDKISTIRDISALFTVAKTAGLISEANYEILVRELSRFREMIEVPLDQSIFQAPLSYEKALPEPKEQEPVKDKKPYEEVKPAKSELLDEIPTRPLKQFGAVSVKKNSRQSVIIALLKRKKEIMIKDVSPLISGCSEKTIQRELSAMVAAGILRKIGDKRWSRYSLA